MSDKEIMGWEKFQAGFSQIFPSLLVLAAKNCISLSLNSSQSRHCSVKGLTEIQPVFPTHPYPFIFLLPTVSLKSQWNAQRCCLLTCNVRQTCLTAAHTGGSWLGWHLSSWHPWISRDSAWALHKAGKNRRLWKMSANPAVFEEEEAVWERCLHLIQALGMFPLLHQRVFKHKTILMCSTISRQW